MFEVDRILEDNMKKVSEDLIEKFKNIDIEVKCDGENVFTGSVHVFLIDNQYQEDEVEKLKDIINENKIEFKEVSGVWEINRLNVI